MTSEEIFAGIDDVPWAEFEHTYGPATEIRHRPAGPEYYADLQAYVGEAAAS